MTHELHVLFDRVEAYSTMLSVQLRQAVKVALAQEYAKARRETMDTLLCPKETEHEDQTHEGA